MSTEDTGTSSSDPEKNPNVRRKELQIPSRFAEVKKRKLEDCEDFSRLLHDARSASDRSSPALSYNPEHHTMLGLPVDGERSLISQNVDYSANKYNRMDDLENARRAQSHGHSSHIIKIHEKIQGNITTSRAKSDGSDSFLSQQRKDNCSSEKTHEDALSPLIKLNRNGNIYIAEHYTNRKFGLFKDVQLCTFKISLHEQTVRERTILTRLDSHPNIVSLVTSGTFSHPLQSIHCLLLKEWHEVDLQKFVLDNGGLCPWNSFVKRVDLCKQLASGMKYIHERSIVHKNLNPSNIWISQGNIKIANFESSQILESCLATVYCIEPFGTLGYRPPESFGKPNSYLSLSSDIYSLGALCFFILSNGQSPFGMEMDLYDHNVINGLLNFDGIPVPNPSATEQLIRPMLNSQQSSRPDVWQVHNQLLRYGEEELCKSDFGIQKESSQGLRKEDYEAEFFKRMRLPSWNNTALPSGQMALRIYRRQRLYNLLYDAEFTVDKTELKLNDEPASIYTIRVNCSNDEENSLTELLQQTEISHFWGEGLDFKNQYQYKKLKSALFDISPDKVQKMAFDMMEEGYYIRSVVLCSIAYDLYDNHFALSEDLWEFMLDCVLILENNASNLSRLSKTENPQDTDSNSMTHRVAWLIEDMLSRSQLNSMTHGVAWLIEDMLSRSQLPGGYSIISKARCLQKLSQVFHLAGMYTKSIDYSKKGLDMLKQQFGDDVANHKCYTLLFFSLASNYKSLGQSKEAEFYCSRALAVCKKAKYKISSEKSDDIQFLEMELSALWFQSVRGDITLHIPYDKKIRVVDHTGKLIEVGGCSVFFPPQCFVKAQKVEVSAKIDPKLWPDGKTAITPTLDIRASNLKKEATVTLSTWCVANDDEEDSTIDVMRFDEERKDWEVIHSCQLGNSRIISFKCKHFSLLEALWKKLFPRTYVMAPRVYLSNHNFAVAVMLEHQLMMKACAGVIRRNLGSDVREFEISAFTCKEKDKVESQLLCTDPIEGFTFRRVDPFAHDITDVIKTTKPSITTAKLKSDQRSASFSNMELTLECSIFRNSQRIRQDDISHVWHPVHDATGPLIPEAESQQGVSQQQRRMSESDCSLSTLSSATEDDVSSGTEEGSEQGLGSSMSRHHSQNRHNALTENPPSMALSPSLSNIETKVPETGTTIINVQSGASMTVVTGQATNKNITCSTIQTVNEGTYNSEKKDFQEYIHASHKS